MRKFGVKSRDISFYSKKNQGIIRVHCRSARKYAEKLETDLSVKTYLVNHRLDSAFMSRIDHVDIRKEYFTQDWSTDFVVTMQEGSVLVCELATMKELQSRASIEKLELSRRYWMLKGCDSWKIIIVQEGGADVC